MAREALVASLGTGCGLLPRLSVAPGGDHGIGLTGGDGGMASPGVVGSVGRDEADGLLRRDLRRELGQHGAITDPAPGDLDGADLHRLGIDA